MRFIAVATALAAAASAQTPDSAHKAAFEVAVVRPAKPDTDHGVDLDKGVSRLTIFRLSG